MKNIELIELLERRLADSIVVRESWNSVVENWMKLGESLTPAVIEYHRAEGAVIALRSAVDLLRGHIRYEEEKQAIANAQNPEFLSPPENPAPPSEEPPPPLSSWPDPYYPGVPPEPEKHRFHWIRVHDVENNFEFQAAEWWPEDEAGTNGVWFLVGESKQVTIKEAAACFDYVNAINAPGE